MGEMRPCPFCGGEMEICKTKHAHYFRCKAWFAEGKEEK